MGEQPETGAPVTTGPPAAVAAAAPAGQGREPNVQVLGRRIVAIIIDTVLVLFIELYFSRPYVPIHLRIQNPNKLHGTLNIGLAHASVNLLLLLVLCTVVYFAVFELLFAATPGKLLGTLRVADEAGNRPRPAAILLRNLVRPIDAIFFYAVGGLSAYLSRLRQRLGDRAAHTIVVGAWSVDWVDHSRAAIWRQAGIVVAGLLLIVLVGGAVTYLTPPAVTPALKESFYPYDVAMRKVAVPGAQRLLGVTVGSAHRSGGTATYPVRFRLAAKDSSGPRTCAGTLTLHWTDPLSGWGFSGISLRCR
jgi:uncharacterized RDD family membrane protein YckC